MVNFHFPSFFFQFLFIFLLTATSSSLLPPYRSFLLVAPSSSSLHLHPLPLSFHILPPCLFSLPSSTNLLYSSSSHFPASEPTLIVSPAQLQRLNESDSTMVRCLAKFDLKMRRNDIVWFLNGTKLYVDPSEKTNEQRGEWLRTLLLILHSNPLSFVRI